MQDLNDLYLIEQVVYHRGLLPPGAPWVGNQQRHARYSG